MRLFPIRPLIRPGEVTQVPVDKLPAYLGFGNVDEVLFAVSTAV